MGLYVEIHTKLPLLWNTRQTVNLNHDFLILFIYFILLITHKQRAKIS